jgi:hypothetical protein
LRKYLQIISSPITAGFSKIGIKNASPWRAIGIIPGDAAVPNILNVFPLAVCKSAGSV